MPDKPIPYRGNAHTYPLTIKALGDLDARTSMSATCRACHHSAPLDVLALIGKLGMEFQLKEIRPLLRCTACGSKDVGISSSFRPTGI